MGWVARYLEEHVSTFSPRTQANKEHALKRFEQWMVPQGLTVEDLGPDVLTKFGKYLLDRKLRPGTVRLYATNVRAFLTWARGRGLAIPAPDPLRIRHKNLRQEPLTPEQLASFVERCARYPDPHYTALMLLPLSGLRVREMVDLRLEHVTLENGFVWLYVSGKSIRDRMVPLSPDGRRVLGQYLAHVRPSLGDSPWLFPVDGGAAMPKRHLQQRMSTISRGTKIQKLSAHRLRHTYATIMHENGIRGEDLARIMGHEDVKTTSIYTHPDRQRIAQAINRVQTPWVHGV